MALYLWPSKRVLFLANKCEVGASITGETPIDGSPYISLGVADARPAQQLKRRRLNREQAVAERVTSPVRGLPARVRAADRRRPRLTRPVVGTGSAVLSTRPT